MSQTLLYRTHLAEAWGPTRNTYVYSQDIMAVFFLNWFLISQLRTLDTNIQALLPCKIKVVLYVKGATKTAYRNRGFCKLKTEFLSSLYPSLFYNSCCFPKGFSAQYCLLAMENICRWGYS